MTSVAEVVQVVLELRLVLVDEALEVLLKNRVSVLEHLAAHNQHDALDREPQVELLCVGQIVLIDCVELGLSLGFSRCA